MVQSGTALAPPPGADPWPKANEHRDRMPHHFTIDVEEYFHPTSLSRWSPRTGWSGMERRSPSIVYRILDELAVREIHSTFFVLGWLAEREPAMVTAIANAGHEVASHGWDHRLVSELGGPTGFRDDVRRAKALLEDITGTPVLGYRAPSFSIVPGFEWAFEVLLEEGYLYDSSLFPTRLHPTYGYPCPRDPHARRVGSGTLVEIPPTTLRIAGTNLPASGGAYFRLLPYAVIQTALASSEKRAATGTFYIHPWELDAASPRLPVPWYVQLRLRGASGDLWARLGRLLNEFQFRRMDLTAREVLRMQET
jgi:polysaccharide deacetylase family protein (PEP-CTERM system associated)